ncbi:MAG: hypothetical protein Q4B92_01215 [Ruminococcus sp.]|nr:hypothetical protein [Ruminococcus sp.]
MSKLRNKALMLSKSKPDYVKDGLVLWLDAQEPFIVMYDNAGEKIRIWRDRAISGQKSNVGGVSQTKDSVFFDGVNSRSKILDEEYINLTGVLSGLNDRTLEVVCKLNNSDDVQVLFLGKGTAASAENGAAGLWYRPSSAGFKVGTWDSASPVLVSDVTERASYSIVYSNEDLNSFDFYRNGTECVKGETAGSMYNTMTTIGARLNKDGSTWEYRLSGEICSIRVYNRKLTEQERLHNLAIDTRRFNLNVG